MYRQYEAEKLAYEGFCFMVDILHFRSGQIEKNC